MNGRPEPSDKPLKQAIIEQVEQPSLPDDQLDTLLNLQTELLSPQERIDQPLVNHSFSSRESSGKPSTGKPAASVTGRWIAIAAVLVLSISVGLLWNTQPDYSRDIAMEVVENHLKLKPLDIATDSMQGLRGFFTQLDFSPTQSDVLNNRFSLTDTQLLGGRYCSIKGDTAAQIRYQGSSGLATFYQVDYQPDRFGHIPDIELGETPITLTAKGLNVSMWVEMGLLMVLIEAP